MAYIVYQYNQKDNFWIDKFNDGAYNTQVFAGAGDDRLIYAVGNDRLYGQGGNDYFYFSVRDDSHEDNVLAYGGKGNDDFVFGEFADTVGPEVTSNDDYTVFGGKGRDTLTLYFEGDEVPEIQKLEKGHVILTYDNGMTIEAFGIEKFDFNL